jgi:hypothetical protein
LCGVFLVPPSLAVRFDVGLRGVPEGHRFRLLDCALFLCVASGVDRVDTLGAQQPPIFLRQRPRPLETDGGTGAEPHLARLAASPLGFRIPKQLASRWIALGDPVPQDPGFRAGARDLQPKAAAVAIHPWRLHARDVERFQFADRHCPLPTIYPQTILGSWQSTVDV